MNTGGKLRTLFKPSESDAPSAIVYDDTQTGYLWSLGPERESLWIVNAEQTAYVLVVHRHGTYRSQSQTSSRYRTEWPIGKGADTSDSATESAAESECPCDFGFCPTTANARSAQGRPVCVTHRGVLAEMGQ